MRQRRVLILNHFAVPRDYPGGTRHVELFSRLPSWSFLIVASRINLSTGKRQDRRPGFHFVPVLSYNRNGLSRILNWVSYALGATVSALTQKKIDVVYASSPHLLAGLAGWVVATVRQKPLVLEIRDLWPRVLVDMGQLSESSLVYRLLERLEGFLYRSADAIVVMSPGTRTALEASGVSTDKIAYIPNAADPSDFMPSASRSDLRRKYEFDRFTVVYAGAHGPANGLQFVLEAAEKLKDRVVDFVLIGDGVEKPKLQEEAQARNLTNVRFLDPVPKTAMPDVLAAADVGLHVLADVPLFRYGVSPNKIFDYMAAGVPIITNCPGVVADAVLTAGAGWVSDPDSIDQAVRQALDADPSTLQAFGVRGRDWIQRHQSRESTSQKLALLLEKLT